MAFQSRPYSLQRLYRTSIVVAGIDDQLSADLMDLVKFAKYNDGYRYIFVVIDVFSKYLWLRKLKDKKGESVANAFETIFKEGRKPYKIRTDKGQEFVQELFSLCSQRQELNISMLSMK